MILNDQVTVNVTALEDDTFASVMCLMISVSKYFRNISSIKPLKTKRRLLYLRSSSYRAVNTFHLGYKNHSVYDISGTSRCLFSDKYKTHKYSVGRAYSC